MKEDKSRDFNAGAERRKASRFAESSVKRVAPIVSILRDGRFIVKRAVKSNERNRSPSKANRCKFGERRMISQKGCGNVSR